MTKKQMETIVAEWIPRLGLSDWDIEVRWDQDAHSPDWREENPPHASTWRSRDYDKARLYFNPDELSGWSNRQANLNVVHELLHLVTRDVEFILDLLLAHLHRDMYSVVSESHRHAVEGAVDRLAYRFVQVAGIS